MNIGEKIKEERLKREWTQEYLSTLLNVSRPTVSSWEVGRNYPDLETIILISDLLEIPLDNLLREDTEIVKDVTKEMKRNKYYRLILKISAAIVLVFLLFNLVLKVNQQRYLSNLKELGWQTLQIDKINQTTDKQFELIEGDTDYYVNLASPRIGLKMITRKDNLVIEVKNESHIELIISKDNDPTANENINVKVRKKLILSDKPFDNFQLTSEQTNDSVLDYISKNKKEYQEMIDNTLLKINEIKKS